jgi:hypothetical protein
MEVVEFECSKEFLKAVLTIQDKLSFDENCEVTMGEVIEEAIMGHFKVRIQDIAEDIQEIKNDNYVYVYVDLDRPGKFKYGNYKFDYEPFYVGKGQGGRKEMTFRFDRKNVKILQINEMMTIHDAYRLEHNLIFTIGRKDLNRGPLLNRSGGYGYKPEPEIDRSKFLEVQLNNLILKALNTSKNKREAAKKLGISERNLYRKINNLKLIKENGTYTQKG